MKSNLAPFVPSPKNVIKNILKYSNPQNGEVLYDLGSGDLSVLEQAAGTYGIKCVGIEINPKLVKVSRDKIRKKNLYGLIEVKEGNILDYPLGEADIVTAYLTSGGMKAIESKVFSELKPSARIVSHEFGFRKVKPNETHLVLDRDEFEPWNPIPIFHFLRVYRMDNIKWKKPLISGRCCSP